MPPSTSSTSINGQRAGSRMLQGIRGLPALVQDVLLAAVVMAVQFVALATTAPDRLPAGLDARPVDAGAYLLLGLATGALIARRRYPYVALALPLAALIAFAALDYGGLFSGYALLVAVYSVVVHRGLRQGVGAGVAVLAALAVAYRVSSWQPAAADNVFDVLAITTAVALGDGTRSRIAAAREQEARAAELAAAQERLARQQVLDERARIARELHDLVAHSMSIVAVQAGVGHHLIDRDPGKAKEALATIETTSRQALTEMRRMLGVLRDDDRPDRPDRRDGRDGTASLEPQPSSSDIAALVDEARAGGLEVSFTVEGTPGEVPAGVELSAYRIVQEALTNVRKHAGPAAVAVSLRYEPDQLHITVDDDGRGVSTLVGSQPGYGLVGMRERAAVVGGELSTGPRPGGGFRVSARLPYQEQQQ